jgi:hypothetical protein
VKLATATSVSVILNSVRLKILPIRPEIVPQLIQGSQIIHVTHSIVTSFRHRRMTATRLTVPVLPSCTFCNCNEHIPENTSLYGFTKALKITHNEEIAPLRQHASVNKLLYAVDAIWHEETDSKVPHLEHSCVLC